MTTVGSDLLASKSKRKTIHPPTFTQGWSTGVPSGNSSHFWVPNRTFSIPQLAAMPPCTMDQSIVEWTAANKHSLALGKACLEEASPTDKSAFLLAHPSHPWRWSCWNVTSGSINSFDQYDDCYTKQNKSDSVIHTTHISIYHHRISYIYTYIIIHI